MAADSKAKFLQDAERYVLHGKVPQAIAEYLKIVKIDSHDVLILNTIGDLYLRQRNVPEATKYFSRVAESYVRNHFFLKAIAVYKKILSADPNNLEVILTIASLYAKQGLSVDARNQYLKVAALLEKEGRPIEAIDVYEKIVELDPANVTIQRKLAEFHHGAGDEKQAHTYWIGTARAQVKSGDLAGAMDSIRKALELDPVDASAMESLLECCRKSGDFDPLVNQLKESIKKAPQNLDLREMLGQVYMEAKDPEKASMAFQMAFSMDESRYEGFFAVAQSLIDKDECDQAANCLDTIIPILITRRETERAAELFEQILKRYPNHMMSLIKMVSIYSATGDYQRCVETLDTIANQYLKKNNPSEALGYLEKIIQIKPESVTHRELHKRAFFEAHPGVPYSPIETPQETAVTSNPISLARQPETIPGEPSPEIVEADLLLNYGLKDKAFSLLRGLESRDPGNMEMRIRLMQMYKADNRQAEAAKECLLLAALCRMSNNEDAAQEYLAEARHMAADMVECDQDLIEFARSNGIHVQSAEITAKEKEQHGADEEVDLSADLMHTFFAGNQNSEDILDLGLQAISAMPEEGPLDEYPEEIQSLPVKSAHEQLQEVDFYIRLGFREEALSRLNEIAKLSPDNPEVAARYQKLDGIAEESSAEIRVDSDVPNETDPNAPVRFDPIETMEFNQGWDTNDDSDSFAIPDIGQMKSEWDPSSLPEASFPSAESFGAWNSEDSSAHSAVSPESDTPDFQANEMFRDLMDLDGGSNGEVVSVDSFENHFSLGTAYRDMDLVDEAIREFESALKSAHAHKDLMRTIQCCGMLSTCFLKKEMPHSVLRWCQTGLGIADNSSHEAKALRYDMGVAHLISGSNEQALDCFDQIFRMDPGYRDVAQKIDELKRGSKRHAS